MYRPILPFQSDAVYEQQVKEEIETYLNALVSYPARAAQEPLLSFEQHLFRLAMSHTMNPDRGREEEVA